GNPDLVSNLVDKALGVGWDAEFLRAREMAQRCLEFRKETHDVGAFQSIRRARDVAQAQVADEHKRVIHDLKLQPVQGKSRRVAFPLDRLDPRQPDEGLIGHGSSSHRGLYEGRALTTAWIGLRECSRRRGFLRPYSGRSTYCRSNTGSRYRHKL